MVRFAIGCDLNSQYEFYGCWVNIRVPLCKKKSGNLFETLLSWDLTRELYNLGIGRIGIPNQERVLFY